MAFAPPDNARRLLRWGLLAGVAAILGGCAGFSADGGMGPIQTATYADIGKDVVKIGDDQTALTANHRDGPARLHARHRHAYSEQSGSKWIPYELARAKSRQVISSQAAGWLATASITQPELPGRICLVLAEVVAHVQGDRQLARSAPPTGRPSATISREPRPAEDQTHPLIIAGIIEMGLLGCTHVIATHTQNSLCSQIGHRIVILRGPFLASTRVRIFDTRPPKSAPSVLLVAS